MDQGGLRYRRNNKVLWPHEIRIDEAVGRDGRQRSEREREEGETERHRKRREMRGE
jgi:hypothetical protein